MRSGGGRPAPFYGAARVFGERMTCMTLLICREVPGRTALDAVITALTEWAELKVQDGENDTGGTQAIRRGL